MTRNHRVVVSHHGGPDVLQVVDEELPQPGAGEGRVRVLAAGVSADDLRYRRSGRLPGSPKVPFTLGEDVVGFVDELGEGVMLERGGHAGTVVLEAGASSRIRNSPRPARWRSDEMEEWAA